MSNSKHTPGPWVLERESDRYIHIVETNGDIGVASVSVDPDGIDPDEANARLIAAAPELLAWCIELLKQLKQDHPNNMDGIKEHVESLIKRATGGDS